MVQIRINSLPPASPVLAADVVAIDGAATRKVTLTDLVNTGRPFASQAEAEAGTDATKGMSPLTTAQAIALLAQANVPIYASKATAELAPIVAGVKSIQTQFYSPSYAVLSTLVGGGYYSRMSKASIDSAGYPSLSYFRTADRFMPDGTTDNTNGGYWVLNDAEPTPQMLGLFDEAALSTDQTATLQAWATLCGVLGIAAKVKKAARIRTTDTVTLPSNVDIDLSPLSIRYNGSATKAVLSLNACQLRHLKIGVVQGQTIDWTDPAYIGIRFQNVSNCKIEMMVTTSFNTGYALVAGAGEACAYNRIYPGYVGSNKIAELLIVTGAGGFINQNRFYDGNYEMSSSANALGVAYGTYVTKGPNIGSVSINHNIWENPCYELGGVVPVENRTPIYFDRSGAYCVVTNARAESNRGPIVICNGKDARRNRFGFTYTDTGAQQLAVLQEVNGAVGNILTFTAGGQASKTFDNLHRRLSSNGGANVPYISGDVCIMETSGSVAVRTLTTASRVLSNAVALELNAATAVIFAVDTTKIKQWRLDAGYGPGVASGNIMAIAFDAAGTRLTGNATDISGVAWTPSTAFFAGDIVQNGGLIYIIGTPGTSASSGGPTGTGSAIVDNTCTWDYVGTDRYIKMDSAGWAATASFGGGYAGGSYTSDLISVRPDVKYMYIGIYGVPVRSMHLTGYWNIGIVNTAGGPQSVSTWVPLNDDGSVHLATAKPDTAGTHGYYSVGQVVYNAGAASGQPQGWQCTTAGWLAAAWVLSTAYSVLGRIVTNDTGKMYQLVTAGTSASSGGPTGTGAAITDGTCVWNYVGVKAVFQTITAGDLLSTNNLSDLANAATALTNLGLTANGAALVKAANYAAMRALLDLEAGTDFYSISAANAAFQAIDPQLSSLIRVNSKSAAYTLVLGDGGYVIFHPAADTTARIWTIPANASVAFPIGTVVSFDNQFGAGAITIAITTDTLELVGSAGSTGSRTLATGGRAVAEKMTSTLWRISGSAELT